MFKYIFGELPSWAKRGNPLLRYELSRFDPELSSKERVFRVGSWVLLLAVLVLGGYIYATNGLQETFDKPYTFDIWRMLFFPLLIVQLIARIAGLSLGINTVREERRRQTWDNLRSTERGADIGLRSRWVSVFYRLRGLLFTVMAGRLILVLAILYELTSMQGGYLDILIAKSVPSISLELGVILLASFMTAFMVMPLAAIGVDVALGLFISTAIKNRAYAGLAQVLALTFHIASTLALFWLTWGFMNSSITLDGTQALGAIGAFSIFGDWGLMLAQFSQTGQIWVDIPNSIFLGFVLLVVSIVQVLISSGLLNLAVYFAEHNE
jgi:hypothetical protein